MSTFDSIMRMLHIVGGAFWVSLAIAAVWVVQPLAKRFGDQGYKVLDYFYAKTNFGMLIAASSVVTIVAGFWVYARLMQLNSGPWLATTGFAVNGIGVVFGLLAFGHGITAMNMALRRYKKHSDSVGDAEMTPEQLTEAKRLLDKIGTNGKISGYLGLIAIITMSVARYL